MTKIKHYLTIFGIIFLTGWIIASIRHVVLYETKLTSIEISSKLNFTLKNTIIEKIKTGKNEKLYFKSLTNIRTKIEDLPYVKFAIITRLPPNTLEIKITEYKPLALYFTEKGLFPINEIGEIIPQDAQLNLPLVIGKASIKNIPQAIETISKYPLIKNQLLSLKWVGNRRWNLELKKVNIKMSENLKTSLKKLNDILKKNPSISGTLDIRDKKRIFLTTE